MSKTYCATQNHHYRHQPIAKTSFSMAADGFCVATVALGVALTTVFLVLELVI